MSSKKSYLQLSFKLLLLGHSHWHPFDLLYLLPYPLLVVHIL